MSPQAASRSFKKFPMESLLLMKVLYTALRPLKANASSEGTRTLPITSSLQEPSPGLG